MKKTINTLFRIPVLLANAADEVAKEMKISRIRVIEIALLEFLFKRDAELSQELLRKYNLFLKTLKK